MTSGKSYECDLKKGIQENILPMIMDYYRGGWVIDVGFNIGTFIDCFLEKDPNVNILAFEPVKYYFEYAAVKYRNKANVHLENCGLGEKDGVALIYTGRKNIGWNTLVKEMVDEDNVDRCENVDIVSLDAYLDLSELNVNVDIVKIDTEGYEYKVLRGMRGFLKEQRPAIICEIGWGCQHPYWEKELEEFEYLYSIGYDRRMEETVKNLKCTTDILFRCV